MVYEILFLFRIHNPAALFRLQDWEHVPGLPGHHINQHVNVLFCVVLTLQNYNLSER